MASYSRWNTDLASSRRSFKKTRLCCKVLPSNIARPTNASPSFLVTPSCRRCRFSVEEINMSTMYKVAPIHGVGSTALELPTCMYKMAPVYDDPLNKAENCNGSGGSSSVVSPLSEVDSYKAAVVDILKKQEDIKKRLQALESSFSNPKTPAAVPSSSDARLAKEKSVHVSISRFTTHDVCMHFPVDYEPVAIFGFLQWLKNKYGVKLLANVHLHSSLLNVNGVDLAPWLEIRQKLKDSLNLSRAEYNLCVTVIVKIPAKDDRLPCLFIDGKSKIYGSNSILRYLARLAMKAVPSLASVYPESETEKAKLLYLIDSILDQIELDSGDGKQSSLLGKINSQLKEKKFLCGDASLADFALCEFGSKITKTNKSNLGTMETWLKSIGPQLCSFRGF